MKSQIKIVKRNTNPTPTDSEAELGTKTVEPSTREITTVVKKWIADLKERKNSHNGNFTPLAEEK